VRSLCRPATGDSVHHAYGPDDFVELRCHPVQIAVASTGKLTRDWVHDVCTHIKPCRTYGTLTGLGGDPFGSRSIGPHANP
jgi:hypothetical protein